nr:sensor domain-containing diguanylate cyclase [candidate division Zixibacteria bacterium]
MRIFQDKGRTILPSVDFIFLISRLLTIFGSTWFVISSGHSIEEYTSVSILALAYLITLYIFWRLIRLGNHDMQKPYLAIMVFEIVFISMMIKITGGIQSDFYLLYYLTATFTAYLMTMRATLVLAGILSITYLVVIQRDITIDNGVDLFLRIGLIWSFPLAVAYVSAHVHRSEQRLLKLFDTLNQRTSELEKSQANLEMIYENSRILAGILDVDEVIENVMNITGKLLAYPASGLILMGHGDNLIYRGRNISGQNNFHLKAVDDQKAQLINRVAKQPEPLIVMNIAGRTDYPPLRMNTCSVMLVPMVTHGNINGVLLAESPQEGAFTEKDLKILSVVARSAGMALENATLHRRMEELTITDELTGIYNYRYFTMKLKEEQRRASRYGLPLSMIMLDIDWFKNFNDNYGHEVGNIVLKGITGVVKKCIRDVDVFARYGGEEFVIILPQTPQDEVVKIGERIRQQIETTVFGGGDIPELKVTISAGVSSFPENGKPNEELLSLVDQALYRAKGSGKNTVCVI